MKRILIALMAVVMLVSVFTACSSKGESNPNVTTIPTPDPDPDPVDVTVSEYDKILTEAYIVHSQPFFGLDEAHYVLKTEDGMISCQDYGYDGDIVKEWVETIYIPISEYTEEEKASLEATMREEFADYDALNSCAVEYKTSVSYFTIKCIFSDVDQEANAKELYEAEIITVDSLVSITKTESDLLAEGYIKK